jgi:hypothetical protein
MSTDDEERLTPLGAAVNGQNELRIITTPTIT